eukprot:jgi/Psemu1/49547/gm1.49547_g
MDQLKSSKGPTGNNNNTNNNSNPNSQKNPPRNWKGNGGNGHPTNDKTSENYELKNLVIDRSKAQQYDILLEGLKVMVEKKNARVKTTILGLNIPSKKYYIVVSDKRVETIDATKQKMLHDLWSKKTERAAKKYDTYVEELKKLFSYGEGQLSPTVKQELKANKDWNTIKRDKDTVKLLTILQEYCYQDGSTMVHPMLNQDINKDASIYVDETKAQFDVLQTVGINIISEDMIKHTLSKLHTGTTYTAYEAMKTATRKVINDEAGQILLSTVIMTGAHPKNHRNVAGVLCHTFSLGTDSYSTTTPKALELLHHQLPGNQTSNTGANNSTRKDNTTDQTSLTIKGVKTSPSPDVTDAYQMLFCFAQCTISKTADADSLINNGPPCPDRYSENLFDEGLTYKPRSEPRSVGPTTMGTTNPIKEHTTNPEAEFIFSQPRGSVTKQNATAYQTQNFARVSKSIHLGNESTFTAMLGVSPSTRLETSVDLGQCGTSPTD